MGPAAQGPPAGRDRPAAVVGPTAQALPMSAARPATAVEAVSGPAVLDTAVPALRRALAGGPPVLVLPPDPARAPVSGLLAADVPLTGRAESPVVAVVATSGSTGSPKGVLLTGAALRASGTATHSRLRAARPHPPPGPPTWLLALPITHVAGLQVLLRADLADTEAVCLDLSGGFETGRFTAAAGVCRRAADAAAGPAYTSLVPTQLARLLDAGGAAVDALAGLDAVLLGGAPAPPPLLARAASAGVRVVVTYGSSETCGGCVYDGVPLGGVTVDVDVDVGGDSDGRVSLAGSVVFSGYLGDPAATAAVLHGDRFATSDRGRLLADGRLEVLGRLDSVIISGGEKISPEAVERVLLAEAGIAEAVVVAVPDAQWGQVIAAVVVAAAGHPAPLLADLRAAVSAALGRAAAPRRLLVLDELPTLALGKPDRQALTALLAAGPTGA